MLRYICGARARAGTEAGAGSRRSWSGYVMWRVNRMIDGLLAASPEFDIRFDFGR